MEKKFSELIKVLNDELSLYADLSRLAAKKTDVLTKGDIDLLGKITAIEQEAIMKIGKLEEQRFKIVKSLAEAYEKEPQEINAEFIEEVMPPDEAKRFYGTYDSLKKVLKDIDEKNRINEILINQALDYIQFSIELLAQSNKQESGYSPSGKTRENALHFIDQKA